MKYASILLLISAFACPSIAEEQPQAASPSKELAGENAESNAASQRRLRWFHEAKYGLFIHWGLWAIPAGEWKGQETSTDPCFVSMEAGISSQEYRRSQSFSRCQRADA